MVKHVRTDWERTYNTLSDGSYISWLGNVCYISNGVFHKADGPAIEMSSGYKAWFNCGKLHRENGPAVERVDGSDEWWVDGKQTTKLLQEEAVLIWKMNEAMR